MIDPRKKLIEKEMLKEERGKLYKRIYEIEARLKELNKEN